MIYVSQEKRSLNASSNESIHKSFAFLIKLGNCLGILPISGLSSVIELKFEWTYWKCFYTYMLIIIYITNVVFCFKNWAFVQFSFRNLATQMHQIIAFVSLFLYLRLSRKWPKFTRLWADVDRFMNPIYDYPKTLNRKIKMATAIIFLACLGEHFLLITYQTAKIQRRGTVSIGKESYHLSAFPEFFSVVPFNYFTAIIVSSTSLMGHLIWSFNDLFIISISSALALRFKQITDRLTVDEKKANSNNYWIELRIDYDRLVHLSKKLDKYISYIVLLSYSANIFFLLVQLSNVIGHYNYKTQIIYYTYSFTFLIARLVAVSLYGAWISDESKEPATCLHCVPSGTYNLEIRRLLLQISFNDVAITGSKMFKVTRGLLLNVAGAVVTYELVMIQFNNSVGSQ